METTKTSSAPSLGRISGDQSVTQGVRIGENGIGLFAMKIFVKAEFTVWFLNGEWWVVSDEWRAVGGEWWVVSDDCWAVGGEW